VIVTVTGADSVPARALPKLIVPAGEMVAAACTAVPLTATICGFCDAVSEISTSAERPPVCVGSKVAMITPVLPPASGLSEQLSVSAKSPGLLPTMLMVIATGVVPVLFTFTTCGALLAPAVCDAKFRLAGVSVMPDVPLVPLSATLCGLPVALSEMLRVALTGSAACGAKSTEIVQLAPAASVPLGDGQGGATFTRNPKLVELLPVVAMPVNCSEALPVFVNVTVCVPLVMPTGCVPKDTEVGAMVGSGAMPVPASFNITTCGEPAPELSMNPTAAVNASVVVGVKEATSEQTPPRATTTPVCAGPEIATENCAAPGPEGIN